MRKYGFSALAAAGLVAGGLSVPSATAADFGGDCCADLEERIAELEATTVRKGNRKVSLTISGFVAQQFVYWDDGFESNSYITDTGSVSIGSHFALSGEARITADVKAGFKIKIEVINNDSLLTGQGADDGIITPGGNAMSALTGTDSAISLESAYWFLKSESLGRISVGQQSSAVDNQAIIVDASGSLVQANYVLYDINGFALRRADGGLSTQVWGFLANCHALNGYGGVNADCDGVPNNNVRYDTPTFAGFSASASWGEDDIWGVSGRYSGTLAQFALNAAVAYGHSSDESGTGALAAFAGNGGAGPNGGLDVGHLQAGVYLEHTPTGLFVYGAYGTEFLETTASARGAGKTNPEGYNYYIKAGIKQKWLPYGSTTLYGVYGENEDRFTAGMYDAGVDSSELTEYGVGVVQNIDAAAMAVWLSWKHYEADVTCNDQAAGSCNDIGFDNGGATALESFDLIKAGALISF